MKNLYTVVSDFQQDFEGLRQEEGCFDSPPTLPQAPRYRPTAMG
jgi:hypothetical protein